VLTNNGSGGFGSNATYAVGNGPYSVVAADVNKDGRLDLVCPNNNDNTLTVLTNNGSGGFGSNATLNVGNGPQCVIAADVNGDGLVDLICANTDDPSLTVLTNSATVSFSGNGGGSGFTGTVSNLTVTGDLSLPATARSPTNPAVYVGGISWGGIPYMSAYGSNNFFAGPYAGNFTVIGNGNLGLGYQAGANLFAGNNNIDIANPGVSGDGNTIRIGIQGVQTSTFIAGIMGATVAGGSAVYVATNGQIGTRTSSERFKQDIRNMDGQSDVLLALRPVTFRYKPEVDREGIPQFGLVAEEVAKVDPDLVLRDEQQRIYSVRYEAVNAMLLNEFLKEHRTVEAQNTEIEGLKQSVAELKAMVEKLAGK
jgi:hypothetical protein